MPPTIEYEKLSDKERDKLLLNLGAAIIDLTGAIENLIHGMNMLIHMLADPPKMGNA